MPKLALIITLICSALGFCVESLAGSSVVRPISFSARQPGNAAAHYFKAFDLLKYPESKKLGEEISDIMENGWLHENTEIEKVLEENKLSIQEFKKGTAIEDCDFDSDKEPKYLFQKQFPAPASWRLFSIIIVKGRYHEKQNDFASAVDLYLSAFIFAQHISQDNLPISKATALVIEFYSLKPLKGYLSKKKIEKQLCDKISRNLNHYHTYRFAAKDIIVAQRQETKSVLKMVADTFMVSVAEKYRHKPEIVQKAAAFRKEFISMANEDLDYYYGNYIRATETNKQKDWEFAISESEDLNKAIQAEINTDHEGALLRCFLDNLDNPNPQCTEKIRILFVGVIPNYKDIIGQYHKSLAELSEVRSLASERCE